MASSGGCCGAANHGIAYSLDPGVYYIRVLSDSVVDLVTPYKLSFSGTVLGTATPDIYEENDSFTTATAVTGDGVLQGYLDTMNDADYFVITVTSSGLFEATVAHNSATSFMQLYNSLEEVVASSGGCCGAATHTLSTNVAVGTYYLRILSDSVFDLSSPYTLSIMPIQ